MRRIACTFDSPHIHSALWTEEVWDRKIIGVYVVVSPP
jgi:hypothetical protein